MNTNSAFLAKLSVLLGMNIVLVVIYSLTPANISLVRTILAGLQLLVMAATAILTIQWILRDY